MVWFRIVMGAAALLTAAACRDGGKTPENAGTESPPPVPSPVVGAYGVELPAADAPGRVITLDLRPDSTCVLKTEFVGKGERTESGVWSLDARLVRILIGPPRDPSRQKRLAFVAGGDSLVSAEWDTVLYGSEGLRTLVRRPGRPAR